MHRTCREPPTAQALLRADLACLLLLASCVCPVVAWVAFFVGDTALGVILVPVSVALHIKAFRVWRPVVGPMP